MFHVVNLSTGEPVRDTESEDGEPAVYSSGADASTAARVYTEMTGVKHQPRPARNTTVDWRLRESERLTNGTYARVPWHDHYWFDWSTHCAHASKDEPGMVAYTPDDAYGQADRQVRAKPGVFLTKFYASYLSADEIQYWVAEMDVTPPVLKFAKTADEIEHVYLNGPNSCMSHDASEYRSPFHPVRVYAAGDLEVAYIERGTRITARALVWPAEKKVQRLYGDEHRLRPLLLAAGYKETEEGFIGAKLLKHEFKGGVVLPYLDWTPWVKERKGALFICDERSGDYRGDRTDGLSGACPETVMCELCGEDTDENYTYTVYGRRGREFQVCESCRDDATYCEDEDIYVVGGHVVEMADGNYWSQWYFNDEGAVCEHTSGNVPADETCDVIVDTDGTTEAWGERARDDDATFYRSQWYADDIMVELDNGDMVPLDSEEGIARQAELDGDDPPAKPYRCPDTPELPLPEPRWFGPGSCIPVPTSDPMYFIDRSSRTLSQHGEPTYAFYEQIMAQSKHALSLLPPPHVTCVNYNTGTVTMSDGNVYADMVVTIQPIASYEMTL